MKIIFFLICFYHCPSRCESKKGFCTVWALEALWGRFPNCFKILRVDYQCVDGKISVPMHYSSCLLISHVEHVWTEFYAGYKNLCTLACKQTSLLKNTYVHTKSKF